VSAATANGPTRAPELPEVLRDKERLSETSSFCFGCHAGLDCFTDCCSDVNIVLTPLDVLSLARATGLGTHEFLEEHTLTPITKELHLPVVMLKMAPAPGKRCPFVRAASPDAAATGCSVYDARPWACRMYPVATAIPPARAGVEPQPEHFLLKDAFCHGHGTGQTWKVSEWQRDQGVTVRDELEQDFQKLVSHPWFIGGRQLDPKRMEMFFTALYDLDAFRRFLFTTTFFERFVIEDDLKASLEKDDHAVLRFAFRWLRFALFGEPTMDKRVAAPGGQP
jgi:uncharacterized protein